ncbi:adhesion protein [Fructilactobacillus fructivorans]|nr:adhesion protein [Fructilactobacillus fructivorans]
MEEYINWLINQMHHQFGTADVEIGGWGMHQFINDLINGYDQDGWNVGKNGYDVNAINNAADSNGLLTYPERKGYEIVAPGYMNFNNFTTMDAIYSRLYSMIMNLTFNDNSSSDSDEMSLLGIDPSTSNVNNSKYLGVGIDNYGQIHLVFVNPAQIQNAKQFNEVTAHIPTPATLQRQIDDTYELISDCHKDLSYDSQTLQNAHDKLAALQNQLANDVKAARENNPAQWSADINKAKAEIDGLNHQISNQQQIINNNNAVLPGLQHKLTQAKQQVENDTNQLNNDQNKLQKATAANQQAQDELARAIQDLINKQNELNRAEQQLQADQAKLIALQKQLIDYQNETNKLAKAKTKMAVDKAQIAKWQKQAATKQSESNRAAQQVNEQIINHAIDQAQQNTKSRATYINGRESVHPENIKTNVTGATPVSSGQYRLSNHAKVNLSASTFAYQSTSTINDTKNIAHKGQLPQTWQSNTTWLSVIGFLTTLLGIFGLAGDRRKFTK